MELRETSSNSYKAKENSLVLWGNRNFRLETGGAISISLCHTDGTLAFFLQRKEGLRTLAQSKGLDYKA